MKLSSMDAAEVVIQLEVPHCTVPVDQNISVNNTYS